MKKLISSMAMVLFFVLVFVMPWIEFPYQRQVCFAIIFVPLFLLFSAVLEGRQRVAFIMGSAVFLSTYILSFLTVPYISSGARSLMSIFLR